MAFLHVGTLPSHEAKLVEPQNLKMPQNHLSSLSCLWQWDRCPIRHTNTFPWVGHLWFGEGRNTQSPFCWWGMLAAATVAGRERSRLFYFKQRQFKFTLVVPTLQIPVSFLSGHSSAIFCVLICDMTCNIASVGIASSPGAHELHEQPSWTTTFLFISPFWACYLHSVSVAHNSNFWLLKTLL